MSLITPDYLIPLSSEEVKKEWEALIAFGPWAVANGCEVEYVQDPALDSEIAIIREPEIS